MNHRLHQGLLFISLPVWVWLGMMLLHEAGHALSAWSVGGQVEQVVVPLLGFSRTDLTHNPSPRIIAWAGPIAGIVLPTAAWLLIWVLRAPHWLRALAQCFAGFCLIANGLYLGVGWIDPVGDADDLLRHGASLWQFIAFGLITAPLGLWLWHGLGPCFGLGAAQGRVPSGMAYTSIALTLVTVAIASILG